MYYVIIILKLIVAGCILNVWLVRNNKSTPYRGGNADSIKEEFEAYGLSETTMKIVGGLKILLSVILLISIFYKPLEDYAAGGIAVLMLGAIAMHLKISDPLMKSMPAFVFLVLSAIIVWF